MCVAEGHQAEGHTNHNIEAETEQERPCQRMQELPIETDIENKDAEKWSNQFPSDQAVESNKCSYQQALLLNAARRKFAGGQTYVERRLT